MPTTVDSPVNRPPKSKSDIQYTIAANQVEYLKAQGWRYVRAMPIIEVTKLYMETRGVDESRWLAISGLGTPLAAPGKETKLTHGTIFDLEEL